MQERKYVNDLLIEFISRGCLGASTAQYDSLLEMVSILAGGAGGVIVPSLDGNKLLVDRLSEDNKLSWQVYV